MDAIHAEIILLKNQPKPKPICNAIATASKNAGISIPLSIFFSSFSKNGLQIEPAKIPKASQFNSVACSVDHLAQVMQNSDEPLSQNIQWGYVLTMIALIVY